jgi:hypothetical protein
MKKLEYNFKNLQFNVLNQLDISTTENEKLMSIFHNIMNYKSVKFRSTSYGS